MKEEKKKTYQIQSYLCRMIFHDCDCQSCWSMKMTAEETWCYTLLRLGLCQPGEVVLQWLDYLKIWKITFPRIESIENCFSWLFCVLLRLWSSSTWHDDLKLQISTLLYFYFTLLHLWSCFSDWCWRNCLPNRWLALAIQEVSPSVGGYATLSNLSLQNMFKLVSWF